MSKPVSDKLFIRTWQEAKSKGERPKWVAKKLGRKYSSVFSRKRSLKKKGIDLPVLFIPKAPKPKSEGWRATMLKLYKDESGISLAMAERAKKARGVPKPNHAFTKDPSLASERGKLGAGISRSTRTLTPTQVKQIRTSTESLSTLAHKYKVSTSTISMVKNRKRYGDVA